MEGRALDNSMWPKQSNHSIERPISSHTYHSRQVKRANEVCPWPRPGLEPFISVQLAQAMALPDHATFDPLKDCQHPSEALL